MLLLIGFSLIFLFFFLLAGKYSTVIGFRNDAFVFFNLEKFKME